MPNDFQVTVDTIDQHGLRSGGTVRGMRRTLDEITIAAAKAGAEQDCKPLSQWVEQAILNR